MDLQLKGKVAVITGGSVGIGLAVAEELASEGVHLALFAGGDQRAVVPGRGDSGQVRCGGHRDRRGRFPCRGRHPGPGQD